MPRKWEIVQPPAQCGRDAHKRYAIEEMDAMRAEKWAWRLFLAVKGTSAAVPEDVAPHGMHIVFIRGLNSFMATDVDFRLLEPLLDDMMTCVKIVRDMETKDPLTGRPMSFPFLPDDIEEPQTVLWLRSEVLRVHTNFSVPAAIASWLSWTMELTKRWEEQNLSTIPTSQPQ